MADYIRKGDVTHQVGTNLPSAYPSSRVTYGNNSNVEEQLNALNPSIASLSDYKYQGYTPNGTIAKIGNLIFISGFCTYPSNAIGSDAFAFLPSWAKPSEWKYGSGSLWSNGVCYEYPLRISAAGNLSFGTSRIVTESSFSIVYSV